MKPHDIRDKTLDEVKNDLLAAQENLRTLKFRFITSQLEKTSMIRQVKRDIARLKTIIREHELGIHTLVVSNVKTGREDT
jgi:large subunit ribosomal protein L29